MIAITLTLEEALDISTSHNPSLARKVSDAIMEYRNTQDHTKMLMSIATEYVTALKNKYKDAWITQVSTYGVADFIDARYPELSNSDYQKISEMVILEKRKEKK